LRLEALGYGDKVYGVKQREYKMNLSKCKAKNKVWTKKTPKYLDLVKNRLICQIIYFAQLTFMTHCSEKGPNFSLNILMKWVTCYSHLFFAYFLMVVKTSLNIFNFKYLINKDRSVVGNRIF
jgi:hypothetical protein